MSRSSKAARKKMKNLMGVTCNICNIMKKDVVCIKKNWFTTINICDSCGRELFLRYRGDLKGEYKPEPTMWED